MKTKIDGYNSEEFCALLREHFDPKSVECWHTGGGTWNPVLVLERGTEPVTRCGEPDPDLTTNAVRYIMFTMGWYQEEASFSLYDDRRPEKELDDEIVGWSNRNVVVPMDGLAIEALIVLVVPEAAKIQKHGVKS